MQRILRSFSLSVLIFSVLGLVTPLLAQRLITDSATDWLSSSPGRGKWKDGMIAKEGEDRSFTPFVKIPLKYHAFIGGDASFSALDEEKYPRIGQYAMAPHHGLCAVKRWVSDVDGDVSLVVDAQMLQPMEVGAYFIVSKNGARLFEYALSEGSPCVTKVLKFSVKKRDVIELIAQPEGDFGGGWTAVRAKIYEGYLLDLPEQSALFSFDQSNEGALARQVNLEDMMMRVPDESGQEHHAYCLKANMPDRFQQGVRGQAMLFERQRTPVKISAEGLGNGAEELSISFWMAPAHHKDRDSPAILTGVGEAIVSANLGPNKDGNPLSFRVQPKGWIPAPGQEIPSIRAPKESTRFNRWTHVTLVWESGERQEIWMDGELVAAHPKPVSGSVDLENWFVGADPRPTMSYYYYYGLLDELLITASALSSEDVTRRYEQALRGAEPGVIEGQRGGLMREVWTRVESGSVQDFVRSESFYLPPPTVNLLGTADTDRYKGAHTANRIRGYIVAPESGYYRFWVAAQGEVDLLLSSEKREIYFKQSIASITRSGGQPKGASPYVSQPFDFYDSQASESMYLEAGESYFLEVLQVAGGNRDNRFALAWKRPTGDREIIPTDCLAPYFPADQAGDKDDDSLPDEWERQYGLNASDNGLENRSGDGEYGDFDSDGLINRLEFVLGLNPANADSDGDGYSDGDEYHTFGSDPAVKDRPEGELIVDVNTSDIAESDHEWIELDGKLLGTHFRGNLSWDFTVDEAGPYFYEIAMMMEGQRVSQVQMPLTLRLDGQEMKSEDVVFSGNALRVWRVHGPPISAGSHRLGLFVNNDRVKRSLAILSVQVRKPEGQDANGDGIPDWYEEILYAGSGVTNDQIGSRFSPVCLEGTVAQNSGSITVNDAPVIPLGPHQWYQNVPLQPGLNELTVKLPDGRSIVQKKRWWITSLLKDQNFRARKGDSIRLGGRLEDHSRVDATYSVNGGSTVLVPEGSPEVFTFESAGIYTIEGQSVDGGLAGTIRVTVLDYDLPEEIAIVSEWERELELPLPEQGVRFSGSEHIRVTSQRRPNRNILKTSLLSSSGGQFALVARIGQDGPIIDVASVPSILVSNALVQNNTHTFNSGAPAGYLRIHAPFVALYMPEGSSIKLGLFRSGMLFTDGSLEKVLTPADFVDGITYVDFLFPKTLIGGFCHHVSVYDRDGVLLNKR